MLRDFGRAILFGVATWLVSVLYVAVFGHAGPPSIWGRVSEIAALMCIGAWCGATWTNSHDAPANVIRALAAYACVWTTYGVLHLRGHDLSQVLQLPATVLVGLHLGVGFFYGCSRKRGPSGSGGNRSGNRWSTAYRTPPPDSRP